jgi:RNA polymerase sigma-70 factor (ECF subfamily)
MSSDAVTYLPHALESATDGTAIAGELVERTQGTQERADQQSKQKGSEISDEQLLDEVRHGQRDALAILFRRHAQSVRNVGRRILRDESEADELLQDVFLYISRKAALFDPVKTSARSWIYHVTYHRAFDRRRYLAFRHFYDMLDLNESVISGRDDQAEMIFDRVAAKGVMEKFQYHLTKEQRQVIHLYFIEGYSLREIAEQTGQTFGNVRNHYYRGLERLRSYVLKEKVQSK